MHNLRDAITFEKATKILGVNRYRLSQMVSEGKLTAHRINGHTVLYERSEVIALAYEIKHGTRRTHPKRTAEPDLEVNGAAIRIDDGINTAQAREITGLSSAEYVCRLAREGTIKGQKMHGRGWVISRRSAEEFRDRKNAG